VSSMSSRRAARGTEPERASLRDLPKGAPLPADGVYMGRSQGAWGSQEGWGNPHKPREDTEAGRAEASLKFGVTLRGAGGRWLRLRLHELRGQRCFCHCRLGHACHVTEVLAAFNEERARAAQSQGELPCLDGLSLAEAGLVLQSHVCWTYEVGPAMGSWHSGIEREGAGHTRELLPFPLSAKATSAEVRLCVAGLSGQPVGELLVPAGEAAWLFLAKWALSWMYEGRKGLGEIGPRAEDADRLLGSQVAAVAKLSDYVKDFMTGPPVPALNWEAEMRKAKLDYNMEEIKRPELVTWAQLEPGLPPPGKAACVRAADLAEGWLQSCLRCPGNCLLPEADWPESPPPGKVWVESDEEWAKICRGAAERGLFTFLKKDEVFHARGEPVLNGLFGVPKKSSAAETPAGGILRLIINAIPTNAYQELLAADIRALPYFGQWSGIHLEDEEMLFTMSELDMTAAFYVFELEPAWWGHQALNTGVPGRLAAEWRPELAAEDVVYPAVKVMMMGWKSACGLMQYFHRRLCFAPPPGGAGLDAAEEVRRDCPVPRSAGGARASALTIYLDNFTQAELIHWDRLSSLDEKSPEVKAVLAAWAHWGVPSQESKAVLRATEHQTLGCRIDGRRGVIGPPRPVVSELLGLTSWFTRGSERTLHQAQVLGGRWVRCFQYRREASSALEELWGWIHPDAPLRTCQPLSAGVRLDLALAASLAPLLVFDLRARISPLVVTSDASETGMGVCRTSALTEEGRQAHLAFTTNPTTLCDNLGLVELFSGIGGVRHALEKLGVRPAVYAAAETQAECRKVIQAAWPEVLELGNVQELDATALMRAVKAGPHVTLWLVSGGFPCQPHSGLNVHKRDFEDDRALHHFVPLIAAELQTLVPHARVEVLGECVASMDNSVRDVISWDFGVRPVLACPSGRLPMRRPRYFWISWQLGEAPGVTTTTSDGVDVLRFLPRAPQSHPESDAEWAAPGWRRASADPLPTFVRAIPRDSPPPAPAGIKECDGPALQRWEADRFRFAPYQYLYKHGMIKGNEWRYPNSVERERLMGFPENHTRTAVSTGTAKSSPESLEDLRLSMLGNSMQAGVVAYLVGWLLLAHSLVQKPPSPELLDVSTRVGTPDMASAGRQLVEELLARQVHRGREVRRLGVCEHPGLLPRATLKPSWWRWRRVFGAPWKVPGEHTNVLEVRAVLAAVQWRVRSPQNIHSKGILAMDSMVALGALAKGRSASQRLRRVVARIGSLMIAASFYAVLTYVRTDLNPADAPSRQV